MKFALLLLGSSLFSGLDPGCGAGAGANVANGPSQGSPGSGTSDGSGTGDTGGAPIAATDCGALGSHSFCADFDTGSLLGGFDNQATVDGSLSLDASDAQSAPHALLATTLHTTTAARTVARLEKKFAQPATHFTLSYAEWLDPSCVGPMDGVETGVIGLHGDTYWVAVRHGNPDTIQESSINGGIYTQGHELASSMPRGRWTRVSLEVDLARKMMGFSVDGKTIVENEPLRYPPSSSSEAPNIGVGTLTDNLAWSPSACQVRIDDVTFDMH